MMKKIIIIIALLFIPCLSFAQTHIPPGDVSGTWTIDGSPYIIEGHISVPVDSTLIIEPGVNIFFPEQNHFRVYGRLLAIGTASNTINFTASDTTDIFAGLYFCETDTSFQDSSKLKHCRFDPGCVGFSNSSRAVVKNCIVTNGYGIGFNNSSTILDNVIVSNNNSQNYGGGISCTDGSSPRLVNVTIVGNSAMWGGGISCIDNSNPTMENVSILNNSTISTGAEIFCEESSPILNNVIIDGNEGSGIRCIDGSSPTLNNVTISNNKIGISAQMCNSIITNTIITGNGPIGGFSSIGGDIILRNVIISDNENTVQSVICFGGGMHINGNVSIVNALIINNHISTPNVGGGGIFNVNGNLSLTNVVITDNYAEPGCGGIWCQYGSNTTVTNSIFWNNNDSQGINKEIVVLGGGWDDEITISYTDIEEGLNGVACGGTLNWGEGNIDLDPLFADTLYHLLEDSPCIDAGNPDTVYYDVEDPENPGFALYPAMGTLLNDMGAYGGHGNYEPPVSIDEPQSNQVLILNNYQNPFKASTSISFSIPFFTQKAKLNIYNMRGQLVRDFDIDHIFIIGNIVWDGLDNSGRKVASGIYFYKLNVDTKNCIKKMLLMR